MELAQEMSAVAVRLPSGVAAMAEPRPDLGSHLRLWSAWDGEAKASRFYRVDMSEEGWPSVRDVTDEVAPTLSGAVVAAEKRARLIAASSRRRARESDWTAPEAWQERHSPTEDVKVRYRQDGARTIELVQCRRRLTDARLWDGLTHEQQQAATDIEFGYRVITHGLGVKLQSFERRDKSHSAGGSGHAAAVSSDYIAWAKKAQQDRIDHAAIMLVLAEGMAPSRVDASRRRRRGYTRGHLIDGLNLYCKQQGWPIQPATTP